MSLIAAVLTPLLLAGPTRVPIQLNGNTMFLEVTVNGSGPYHFILDTGALASSVGPEVVAALGLPSRDGAFAHGAGGSVASAQVPHVTLGIGDARLADLEVGSFPLTSIENSVGRRIDGIVGAELFQRFVVEIDYLKSELVLYEPKGFSADGRGKGLPLRFYDNHPYVKAAVTLPGGKEIEGEFVLDSGSSFPLILLPSFIEDHELRGALPPSLTTFGRGVGGEVPLPVGRAPALRLGEAIIERPVTGLPQTGMFGREGKAGNIGGAILKRFRVTFDYSRKRVYFQPNERFSQPYEFDMSGLALVTEGPDFALRRVLRVLPASPADEAGLAAGDELVSFDGKPAASLTLPAMREILREPGREIAIQVSRGGSTVAAVLRTRRLV